MNNRRIIIATRKSPLALWQAEFVKSQLLAHHPDLSVELLKMTTKGDKILDTPLAKVGGKGLFVKELETALLNGDADIAVHSMKDVPMEFPSGLGLSTICPREDPRDAFVSNRFARFKDLPNGATVGTSSLRRHAQIAAKRPDLKIQDLRGNVGTRLKKLDDEQYDAIILASAGLIRLGLSDRIAECFSPSFCLPACGQGAVGIESRDNDSELHSILAPLNDSSTAACVLAERAFNRRLQGGCQAPIGGHATLEDEDIHLDGLVASLDGREQVRAKVQGSIDDAEQLGEQLANSLLEQGADAILEQLLAQ